MKSVCGQLAINTEARRVWVSGKEIRLAMKEFDLLAMLVSDPGRAWSKTELLTVVWGENMMLWQNATVIEHVGRLRKKLKLDPQEPPFLQTVRGHGYRYERREEPRWEPDQVTPTQQEKQA